MVVLASLVIRGFLLERSWFWQDDFVIAARAFDGPLTLSWLFQDYLGHLMPLKFLQAWGLARFGGMSWSVACAITLLWSAAFGWAFWSLARGVVRSGAAALLATAVAVSCPLWSVSVSWFASSQESLPSLTLVTLASVFLAAYMDHGRRRSLIGFVVAYACALLWYEKAVLGVVLFALVAAAVVSRDGLSRSRRSRLMHLGSAWLLTSIAYVSMFLLLIGPPEADAQGEDVRRLVYEVALSVVPTGLVGGPWQQNVDGRTLQPLVNQPWLLWIWAVLAAVLVLALRRHRPSAILGATAVIAIVAIDVALVARNRIGFLGPVIGRDTRYTVDVVPIAAFALALAIAGGRPARSRLGAGTRSALVRAAPGLAALYLLVAWPSIFFVGQSRASIGADVWVDQALQDAAAHPDRVLASTGVPDQLVSSTFGADSRASRVLRPFGVPSDRFDQPGTQWWRFSQDGTLAPISMEVRGGGAVGTQPDCGIPVRGSPVTVPVPSAGEVAAAEVDVVRLTYFTGRDLTAMVESGARTWEVDFPGGAGILYLPGEELGGTLRLSGLGASEAFCLTALERGLAH